MEVMLQPKPEADDTLDDVVFLHRAMPGECVNSFGWHCALNADIPDGVVSRARQISHCRSTGEPLLPLDSDSDYLQK